MAANGEAVRMMAAWPTHASHLNKFNNVERADIIEALAMAPQYCRIAIGAALSCISMAASQPRFRYSTL